MTDPYNVFLVHLVNNAKLDYVLPSGCYTSFDGAVALHFLNFHRA